MDNTHVLIVEDDVLIAMDLEDELTDQGFAPVTAATVPDAQRHLAEKKPVFAVLDMHLKADTTFDLAAHLRDHQIPFVFLSGNDASSLPDHLKTVQVLTKPVLLDDLVKVIKASIGTG